MQKKMYYKVPSKVCISVDRVGQYILARWKFTKAPNQGSQFVILKMLSRICFIGLVPGPTADLKMFGLFGFWSSAINTGVQAVKNAGEKDCHG